MVRLAGLRVPVAAVDRRRLDLGRPRRRLGQTYTLGPSDVGAAVRLMVTAVNSSGSATAASAGFEVYPAGNLVSS